MSGPDIRTPSKHPTRGRRIRALAASAQSGFALIEVIASAALLSVIALGVFAGIDGPAAVSSANQSRSIAASLAQQDQDRLRGLKVTDIGNYSQPPRSIPIANVNYTVASQTQWVSDSSGSLSCTGSSSGADYLKITSSVTWPTLARGKPVTLESIVSPPPAAFGTNQGNLSIQLLDQAGAADVGVPVTLTPTGTLTLATNGLGCAFFGYLAVGSYNATFSQPGYADPSGKSTGTLNGLSVTNGATTATQANYAPAAQITANFDTQPWNKQAQPAGARSITVSNSGIPNTGMLGFPAPGAAPVTTINASSLYPFTSGYGVYAGSCVSDSPPSAYLTNAAASPGGSSSVTVREPALNVTVTNSLGAPLPGARIRVTAASPCAENYTLIAGANGAPTTPELPYGTYTVCADDRVHSQTLSNVAETTPAGNTPVTLAIPASGQTVPCP